MFHRRLGREGGAVELPRFAAKFLFAARDKFSDSPARQPDNVDVVAVTTVVFHYIYPLIMVFVL